MPIHLLPPSAGETIPDCWHLDGDLLASLPPIADYPRTAADLVARARRLAAIPVGHLAAVLSSFADEWLDRRADDLRRLQPLGVAFGLAFLRRESLDRMLRESSRGDRPALDGFGGTERDARRLAAVPRGLVTHWVAGNVPILGWLSLVQGLLSKNANVVKVPRRFGRLLPWMLRGLGAHEARCPDGSRLSGSVLADAVLPVYCGSADRAGQSALSAASDARVVWGSRDAVAAVRALPAAPHVEDVVFGPRRSIAVIGREVLDDAEVDRLADRVALDASYFEQRGCNAPHTVFVEQGGRVDPPAFAAALAGAMSRVLARVPKGEVTPGEAFRAAAARAEWTLRGRVHAPAGPEWTVVLTEGDGPVDPVGSRVVFVRPVESLDRVLSWLDRSCQTIGLAAGAGRAGDFALEAARRGVDRIVPPGRMSAYDQPWDGLFVLDRLVRWVTLER